MNLEQYPTPRTNHAANLALRESDMGAYLSMSTHASKLERELAACRDALKPFAESTGSILLPMELQSDDTKHQCLAGWVKKARAILAATKGDA